MSGTNGAPGLIQRFLSADHRRLEALSERATADPEAIDLSVYKRFRAGLLKHIAMEEKILIPAAREASGSPPSLARRIRLDHAAITALLAPTPTRKIAAALDTLLSRHDELEEQENGLYEECEHLLGSQVWRVFARLRNAPDLRLSTHADGPRVMESVRRIVAHAGYDLDRLACEVRTGSSRA